MSSYTVGQVISIHSYFGKESGIFLRRYGDKIHYAAFRKGSKTTLRKRWYYINLEDVKTIVPSILAGEPEIATVDYGQHQKYEAEYFKAAEMKKLFRRLSRTRLDAKRDALVDEFLALSDEDWQFAKEKCLSTDAYKTLWSDIDVIRAMDMSIKEEVA